MRYFFLVFLLFSAVSSVGQRTATVTLYFELATTTLTAGSEGELANLLSLVKREKPSAIRISGHADITGNDEINNRLSYSRAMFVLKELEQLAPDTKFSVTSHGASLPVSMNEDEQHKNRRVEIVIQLPDPSPEDIVLEPYKKDVEEQRFVIDLDDTVRIYGKEGTFIKISPGSLTNRKGELVYGEAILFLKEYYSPSQIILAGLHTVGDNGILQTGGMFKLLIVRGKDTMASKTKKPVEVRMPAKDDGFDDMNVFVIRENADSTRWENTGSRFNRSWSYWNIPASLHPLPLLPTARAALSKLSVGKKTTLNGKVRSPFISFTRKRQYMKSFSSEFQKTDDRTVVTRTIIHYTGKGFRKFGKRTLDTSYVINWFQPEYFGYSGYMNWINCDRFLNSNNNIDFYVHTPGYKNMRVIVYFQSIRSFLNANNTLDGQSIVQQVPMNVPVTVLAVGTKDGQLFFGRQDVTTKPGEIAVVKMAMKSQQEFASEMASLK